MLVPERTHAKLVRGRDVRGHGPVRRFRDGATGIQATFGLQCDGNLEVMALGATLQSA